MSLTVFFGLLGGIVVLAFLANRLAGWTRVPDVVVLMAAGMLLGPVFHLLDPSRFEAFARGFGALALILILFEAGLDLEFRNTLRHLPGGVLLAVLSYGLSLVAIAAADGHRIAPITHLREILVIDVADHADHDASRLLSGILIGGKVQLLSLRILGMAESALHPEFLSIANHQHNDVGIRRAHRAGRPAI